MINFETCESVFSSVKEEDLRMVMGKRNQSDEVIKVTYSSSLAAKKFLTRTFFQVA